MPTGPQGQHRPADVIGCAAQVARLSVGPEAEDLRESSGRARSGHAGTKTRAERLGPEKRREIGRRAAQVRWG